MRQVDFENGSVSRNIFMTSLPMLVAQVLNLLYSIVDRIYIGRIPGMGTLALGGVGLCFPVIMMVTAFTNLYGMGGAPLCSMARGRGDRRSAEKIMNLSFFMLLGTAAVILVLGEVFTQPLLIALGATEGNISIAAGYLRIYLLGTFFTMIATGLNPYINAQGFSGVGMLTVLIGAVTNILLDPLFIFTLGLGVRGAAIATVLSQALSAVFVLRFLTGGQAELRLRLMTPRQFRDDLSIAGEIVSLGLSSFIMQFTNSLVNIVCNNMLAAYGGELYVSIMTVVNSVRQITETPVLAIADGGSPVLSYNYGARRPQKVRRGIFLISAMGLVYSAAVWILIERFPAFFIGIFSPSEDFIAQAVPALHIYFFAFVFMALQYAGQTTFKALGKKKHAIFFSLFRKVVIVVPLAIILPGVFSLGTNGVFMAEPISNVIGGTACYVTMLLTVMPELKDMENSGDP